MRIAILISGRAVRYEVCLLPFLYSIKDHEIHLFMSINDEDCEYYNVMREKLGEWLKGVRVEPFVFPKPFLYTNPKRWGHQLIDGEWLPYNMMSMYYNDKKAFEMATQYADANGCEYDYYMKFRSDILTASMAVLEKPDLEDPKLYYVILCNPISYEGLYQDKPRLCISDAWAWGVRSIMQIYCNTYEYVLRMISERNGNYFIMYEHTVSDNLYYHNLTVEPIPHPYLLDINRRIFDKAWLKNSNGEAMDNRAECWPMPSITLSSKDVATTDNIVAHGSKLF